MSDLTTGYTWASGATVTPSKLNDAMGLAVINADAITTAKIINDAVTTAKILDANVTVAKLAGTLDLSGKTLTLPPVIISGAPEITTTEDGDYFWIWDATDSALKKVSKASLAGAFTPAGSVVQTVYAENATYSSLTKAIPYDDSIPQITEGTQILSQAITLSSVRNKVLILITGNGYVQSRATGAIFRNSGTDAVYAQTLGQSVAGATTPHCWTMEYLDSPSSDGEVTYTVNFGADSGIFKINGKDTSRLYGGVSKVTLTLQEIKGA
ncbi:MAG: hypothetical protein WCS65_04505 [Verrucomicrobiae bacterium]